MVNVKERNVTDKGNMKVVSKDEQKVAAITSRTGGTAKGESSVDNETSSEQPILSQMIRVLKGRGI